MQTHPLIGLKVQSVLTLTILIGVLLFSSCGQKPVSNTVSAVLDINEQGLLDMLYAGLDEDSLQSGAVPGRKPPFSGMSMRSTCVIPEYV